MEKTFTPQLDWGRIGIEAPTIDLRVLARRATKKRRAIVRLPQPAAEWLTARRGTGQVIDGADVE